MTMLGEITERMRGHYRWIRGGTLPDDDDRMMADALRDAHAAKLKAEWEKQHYPVVQFCCGPQTTLPGDPRHKYDDSAWQAEADRTLKRE